MEKARYYIRSESIDKLISYLSVAAERAGAPLFALDDDNTKAADDSLLAALHPTAIRSIADAIGDTSDEVKLGTLVARASESDDSAGSMLSAGVLANPYRWFNHDTNDGFRTALSPPAGAALALDRLPPWLKLDRNDSGVSVRRTANVRVEFLDSEGPGQIHRLPGRHGGVTFLRREHVDRVLDLATPLRHQLVNVIVVDQGMHPGFVNDMAQDAAVNGVDSYGGILWHTINPPIPTVGHLPTDHKGRYRSRPQWHAHMIIRNILAVAGDNRGLSGGNPQNRMIRFWDVPVLPDRVTTVTDPSSPFGTAEHIEFQYDAISVFAASMAGNERLIVVNAWGVKNRFRESAVGDFTEDDTHDLNDQINDLALRKDTAVVFAAGNNGMFSPDPEVGALDRGPGRSLFLPAALNNVWTVGATDANGTWLGLSSQGPSPYASAVEKPDLNVPSHFAENLDAHVTNTGTSASCALMAGLLAARWRHNNGTGPSKPVAKTNAKKRSQIAFSNRLGAGSPRHGQIG